MKRIPTLDGWRGIAILLVLIDHFGGPFLPHVAWIGQHGVAIFFVLSGFLITSKLREEYEATDRIDLKAFYLRRIFRILPCAWTYLAIVAILHLVQPWELTSALLSFRNFAVVPRTQAITNHFWSLSIEEQFYLFWPMLLLLLKPRRARYVAVVLACIIAAIRFGFWLRNPEMQDYVVFQTQYRADALLIGCAAASIPHTWNPSLRIRKALLVIGVLALLPCLFIFRVFIPLAETLLIALLVWGTATTRLHIPEKLLNWRPLAQLGIMSYSVYVWQDIVRLYAYNRADLIPAKLLILAVLACASFYGIEQPCIRIGKRLIHTRQSPERELQLIP